MHRGRRESVARPLVQRRRPARAHRRARHMCCCRKADRRGGADRRPARSPLSDDRRPQGAARPMPVWCRGLSLGCSIRRVDRAVWPSTGNYCRGGVAISRILGCRGVAVLPAGMSRERFDWLEQWVADPSDIIRTPGTESNVKEIYDKCAELAAGSQKRHPQSVLRVRQLSDPLPLHRRRPSTACLPTSQAQAARRCGLPRLSSATGSAGTIAAGDHLKERSRHPDRRGRGDRMPDHAGERLRRAQHPGHRRQAHPADPQRDEHRRRHRCLRPGDRRAQLSVRQQGRARLSRERTRDRRRNSSAPSRTSASPGLPTSSPRSSWPSIWNYGPDDVVMTVATDSAGLYASERTILSSTALSGRV